MTEELDPNSIAGHLHRTVTSKMDLMFEIAKEAAEGYGENGCVSLNYRGQEVYVTAEGVVHGKRGPLKQRLYQGYPTVTLGVSKRTRVRVHQLVAKCWCGDRPSDKHCVNHKDGIKTNNHPSNLEWVTWKENIHHAFDNELRDMKFAPQAIRGEHPDGRVVEYSSQSEANKDGFQQANIYKCLAGLRPHHKGFIWSRI